MHVLIAVGALLVGLMLAVAIGYQLYCRRYALSTRREAFVVRDRWLIAAAVVAALTASVMVYLGLEVVLG